MIESFPPYRLLAEPLHDHGQSVGTQAQSDLPFEFCSGHLLGISSGPSLRLAGLGSYPSTRLQNHRCNGAIPTGHSRVGFGETSEAKLGGRKHDTKLSTTCSGAVMVGWEDLKPGE